MVNIMQNLIQMIRYIEFFNIAVTIKMSLNCDYCQRVFTDKSNKYRHMRKFCKKKSTDLIFNQTKILDTTTNVAEKVMIDHVIHGHDNRNESVKKPIVNYNDGSIKKDTTETNNYIVIDDIVQPECAPNKTDIILMKMMEQMKQLSEEIKQLKNKYSGVAFPSVPIINCPAISPAFKIAN